MAEEGKGTNSEPIEPTVLVTEASESEGVETKLRDWTAEAICSSQLIALSADQADGV